MPQRDERTEPVQDSEKTEPDQPESTVEDRPTPTPQVTGRPAASPVTSKQTVPPVTGKPAVTQETGKPTVPQESGKTAVPQQTGKPVNGANPFPTGDLAKLQEEWHTVQASFVDDPAASVREADALVGRMIDRITEQRKTLSQRHNDGADGTQTEDLRQALRHYRTMFQQLMPNSR